MKNPLVLFVGAAVVAVGALAGAMADRWQDWPGPVPPSAVSPDVVSVEAAELPGEPERKLPPPTPETDEPSAELRREQPAETDAGPAPRETDEQVAAVGPDEIDSPEIVESPEAIESPEVVESPGEIAEAPVDAPEEPTGELAKERTEHERLASVDAREVQPAAPSAPAAPHPQPEASVQPSFDVVRLQEDGSLIVAGLAAPGAEVTLLLDGEAIASDAANDFGAWLLMPDAPLPPGSHQLMVQARDADSGAQTSGTIAVAVPERAADRPRVAHSEPAQPPAAQGDVAAAPEPAEMEKPARLEPEEPQVGQAEEEQVALAPVQEPDVEVEAPVVREDEPGETEARETGAEPEEHAAVAPEAEANLEPESEVDLETGPERRDIPLALETVDYNDAGEIVFSGRAGPGSVVRIHVDNRLVGETMADADGRWVFAGGDQIASGRHTLRADLMGADGNVVGRIILPFMRADGREVAALVEERRQAVVQREPEVAPEVDAPEPAEAEAQPEAPEVTEDVAPEPGPEAPQAPAVVDAAPEPEPDAPAVADEVATEPELEPEAPAVAEEVMREVEAPKAAESEAEPKAPEVSEEVAPELEPEAPSIVDVAPKPLLEAPAVAEEGEPVPEPEAPLVAEEVAPEPEPEAPVVTQEVAPEPEPEAPVATDEVGSEPEPEAPLVAEGIAPEPEPEEPSVADGVAPEPKPEAPVVADEVGSEPEPKAPVVAEEAAPETEPEAPAVVDVAPEPEPEAPVVAEVGPETAPGPEVPAVAEVAPDSGSGPEAPVVADEVATPVEPSPETALTDQPAPEADAADWVAAAEPEMVEPAASDETAVGKTAAEVGGPEVAAGRPGHVVIQPGNNLWRISRVIYGRGIEYTAIYEANRDKISDPDLIYPGQIFATPGVDPPKEIDPEWREPLGEGLARQDAAE